MKKSELKTAIKEIITTDLSGKSNDYRKGFRQGMNDHLIREKGDYSHMSHDFQEGYKKGWASARNANWSDKIGKFFAGVGDVAGLGFKK